MEITSRVFYRTRILDDSDCARDCVDGTAFSGTSELFVDTPADSNPEHALPRFIVPEFDLRRSISTSVTPFASSRCAIGCNRYTKVATAGNLMTIL